MRILCLSLLRLGDYFQHHTLVQEMVDQGHEVHVLVNEGLETLETLFPQVRFHFFPRSKLQSAVTQSSFHPLTAYQHLKMFVQDLNFFRFDRIENWTHTYLSTRLMDLLEAREKMGSQARQGELLPLENGFRYFNETWGPTKAASFHIVDALAMALRRPFPLLPQARIKEDGTILLQVLTSDAKKNWPLANWLQIFRILQDQGRPVKVLCAPFERDSLLQAGWKKEDLLEANLVEVPPLLQNSRLFIGGDSALLHLATLFQVPSLGIYLGSADPRKTGPRLEGSRILWGRVTCSPCRHSQSCSQPEHFCSQKIQPQDVIQEISAMLDTNEVRARKSLETQAGVMGSAVIGRSSNRFLANWSQVVWEFYLNRDHELRVAPYGSAARLFLSQFHFQFGFFDWVDQFRERLELSLPLLETISATLWSLTQDLNEQNNEAATDMKLQTEAEALQELWHETDFVSQFLEATRGQEGNPFVKLRNRKAAFHEMYELFNLQTQLFKVLDHEIEESGGQYGARA